MTPPHRRHFIPPNAPLKRYAIRGTVCLIPVWDDEDDRYWMMCLTALRFDLLAPRWSVCIGSGYLTDGSTKPRAAWTALGDPYSQRDLLPSILHDACYEAELFPRSECDQIFLDFMQDMGVSWSRRNAIYSGVRAGGWWYAWRHHTAETVAEARRQVRLIDLEAEPEFPAPFLVSAAPAGFESLKANSGKW